MTSEEFKIARRERRIGVGELAMRFGVDRKTIYRYENGKTPIPDVLAAALLSIPVPKSPAPEQPAGPVAIGQPWPIPCESLPVAKGIPLSPIVWLTLDGLLTSETLMLTAENNGTWFWWDFHLAQVAPGGAHGHQPMIAEYIDRCPETGRAYMARGVWEIPPDTRVWTPMVDDPKVAESFRTCANINAWLERLGRCLPENENQYYSNQVRRGTRPAEYEDQEKLMKALEEKGL